MNNPFEAHRLDMRTAVDTVNIPRSTKASLLSLGASASLRSCSGHSLLCINPVKVVLLAVGLCFSPLLLASDVVLEPDGYRLEEYDAPVPETLTGATLVDALEVRRLRDEEDALVIDVIPEHRRPDFLPENQIWIPVPHKGVPGSVWLPDIGYGVLADITLEYFSDNLAKHTDGNQNRPVVFYCRLDCWMSWNAAKRAVAFGYTDVYWFADGTDGWMFEGLEMSVLTPEPGARH